MSYKQTAPRIIDREIARIEAVTHRAELEPAIANLRNYLLFVGFAGFLSESEEDAAYARLNAAAAAARTRVLGAKGGVA